MFLLINAQQKLRPILGIDMTLVIPDFVSKMEFLFFEGLKLVPFNAITCCNEVSLHVVKILNVVEVKYILTET